MRISGRSKDYFHFFLYNDIHDSIYFWIHRALHPKRLVGGSFALTYVFT